MLDRFIRNLYERIIDNTIQAKDVNFLIEEEEINKKDDLIPVYMLKQEIDRIQHQLNIEKADKEMLERKTTPIKKFLYVEDGSVDTDSLIQGLEITNPEIRVIVYRQGSKPPILLDVMEQPNGEQSK